MGHFLICGVFSAAQQLCPIVSLSGRHITREHTANVGEGDADEEDDELLVILQGESRH